VYGFKIDKSFIGDNGECYIIAEAGSNHDQEKKNALELIDAAAEAGANAIKFQLFNVETLYSKYVDKEIYDKTRHAQMPLDWVPELIDRCKSQQITFLATPFDLESVNHIKKHKVPAIKWASGEINNLELLSFASKLSKPMIISTGMSNIGEIERAINVVEKEKNSDLALLHCISIYPTEYADANLRMMDTLSQLFDYPVGFSDHTLGTSITVAAVARGAKIIEKHLTLDKNISSPDHPFSLHPHDFKALVKCVREIESSLGIKCKKMIKNERPIARIARRSLVASKPIPLGSRIDKGMITAKRPGTGISPEYLNMVIGRTINKDLEQDEILEWEYFS
jgi:N-acetylneuraminate synthase/N,N'-diacetyllegionaminate synthase